MREGKGPLNKASLRSMAILDYIAAVGGAVSIAELSRSLAIPKSSVFNIVYTLLHGRYLEIENEQTKTFRLGFRLFQTGITYLANAELHSVAHPMLHDLMHETGETVHLATEDEEHLVFLDSIEAENSLIRSVARLGQSSSPMYRSGLGKALLAARTDEELVERFRGIAFEQATENTLSTFNQLMDDIRAIRSRGYALDECESGEELYCVACPVYDRSQSVIAAISCSVPYHKINGNEQRKSELVEKTVAKAMQLSQRLGFLGNRFYGA